MEPQTQTVLKCPECGSEKTMWTVEVNLEND